MRLAFSLALILSVIFSTVTASTGQVSAGSQSSVSLLRVKTKPHPAKRHKAHRAKRHRPHSAKA